MFRRLALTSAIILASGSAFAQSAPTVQVTPVPTTNPAQTQIIVDVAAMKACTLPNSAGTAQLVYSTGGYACIAGWWAYCEQGAWTRTNSGCGR